MRPHSLVLLAYVVVLCAAAGLGALIFYRVGIAVAQAFGV